MSEGAGGWRGAGSVGDRSWERRAGLRRLGGRSAWAARTRLGPIIGLGGSGTSAASRGTAVRALAEGADGGEAARGAWDAGEAAASGPPWAFGARPRPASR
ncbi:hypothetical protein GCM10027168_54480 [Streptomyces capparidis]